MVEDLEADRELYRRSLDQESGCLYKLLEAESVAAGLALCRAQSIDAILLDYLLPDGDGLDFLTALSIQSHGRMPPVVMMTGQGNESAAARAIKLGAEDYLIKHDLTPELLQLKVRRSIENAQQQQQELAAQKQLELTQQAANRQITTIWESITDAYAMLDLDWRVVYTNPVATEVYFRTTGLVPEEYLGKAHWEVFPWTVGTIVEQEYRRAMAEQVAVSFEFFYQPTATWFEIHAYPSTEGLGLYFRDINQRKLDELARSAAERDRDRFFALSLDLLIVANFDGYFVRVNPACEKILGFTGAEITAQPFLDFVHPDDLAATAAVAESLSKGNELHDFENRYRCKDGSYRWILWSAISDAENNLIYATGHDITDRKITELNDRFLHELIQRLRQLSDVDAIQWEATKSLGEYLNVDRASWFEVDPERGLAIVDRDWYREGLVSQAGVYTIADFVLPELLATLSAGKPVAIANVASGPFTAAQIATYEQLGISAFVIIPWIEEGRWVATLNLNTKTERNWRKDEIQMLQTVVAQLGSIVAQVRGVQALRAQEQQTRAAQAIVEQQLREIETIYQTAPVGLCYVDTDLRFVRINERLAQTNGLPVAAHIGRTIGEMLSGGHHLEPLYRQVIESGEPILNLELSGMDPKHPGVMVHCLVGYYPQKDAQGRVVGVNAMVQDITDRKSEEVKLKQAQETIQQQLDEIESIYRAAPIGLSFVSSDLKFIRINEQLARINGLPAAEHIGLTLREVLPEIADTIEPLYQQVIESGEPIFNLEVSGVVPSQPGVERQWFVSYYPQIDTHGRVVGVNAMVQDITDRKRDQAALEARNQELDAFVSVVSHDLKAPLRAVANLSQWIEEDLEGLLTAETQSQMNLLRSRVHRMAATIDGLLEYARIGRSEDEIELVSVAQLLADVIEEITPPSTFTIDLPNDLPTLTTKRLPLFQVFANLIGNGIKHHHSETGSIKILLKDRGDWYEFVIADDGPGIATEHHQRMFKIFQAVNPQNRSDSTGIGLAIVKKIIESEGGTIWLESEIGNGTTFYFTWPKRSGRLAN
jgi:PAS domain S-box-containing protein